MNPFDFVGSITTTKVDLIAESEDSDLIEKEYVPFLVNKALSYFPDTILYANEINQRGTVDNKLQYHYLLYIIRPQKRFAKWSKKVHSDDFEVVKQYYGYNDEKTYQSLALLTKDQIIILKEQLEKGG